jgi:hypothetical protein
MTTPNVQGFGYGFRNPGFVIANQVIVVGNNPQSGIFVYSPTLGAGNLVGALTAQAGTDPYGNTYSAGLTIGNRSAVQVVLGLFAMQGIVDFPLNNASYSLDPQIIGAVAGAFANMNIRAPTKSSHPDTVLIELNSSDGSSSANGEIIYSDTSNTSHLIATWDTNGWTVANPAAAPAGISTGARIYGGASHLKYVANDGNAYNTGRVVAEASGTTTINLTTNIPITGTIIPVIAGTYLVRGYVHGTNGAVAATQAVSITGPAASNFNVEVDIRSATANTYKAFGEITSSGSRVGTAALAIGEKFVATYSGIITFTASGNVQLGGSCVTAAADTWTADATTHLILEPVT